MKIRDQINSIKSFFITKLKIWIESLKRWSCILFCGKELMGKVFRRRNWLLGVVLGIIILVTAIAAATLSSYISEIITLFFSAVVATATVFYALLTSELLSETKKTREILTNPKIAVDVHPRFVQQLDSKSQTQILIELIKYQKYPDISIDLKKPRIEFDLVVRNIGPGPAYDVTGSVIEIKSDVPPGYQSSDELVKPYIETLFEGLTGQRFFESEIDYIAPNDKKTFFFWAVSVDDFNFVVGRFANSSLKIKIKYYKYPKEMREAFEAPFDEPYLIDFSYVAELIPDIVFAGDVQKVNV